MNYKSKLTALELKRKALTKEQPAQILGSQSSQATNSAMGAINEYVKEFDLLADSDSRILSVKVIFLLVKYSTIFKRLL
jgi:hypothetical protein